jgi:uncharacterized membrane protein YgdD (TMEM256/DUF423 family)
VRLRVRTWLTVAAVNGGLAVALGAFAAHGLSQRLDPRALSLFETGARYQMYHALAIGLCAFALQSPAKRAAIWAASLFLVGVALFSGSLYALALTGWRAIGFVTPVGGVLLLAGWALLALAAWRLKP